MRASININSFNCKADGVTLFKLRPTTSGASYDDKDITCQR